MTAKLSGSDLIQGDCLDVLPRLPADHFHCVVTSPPYFALRSYLPKDHPLKAQEIGSESTPEKFMGMLVWVFRQVRRVMHPSGLLFLNMGDSYGGGYRSKYDQTKHGKHSGRVGQRIKTPGIDGQPLGIPHHVKDALQADGWIWRQTIIWAKKSPMPESVKGWRWERCRVKVKSKKITQARQGAFSDHSGNAIYNAAQYAPCPGCPKCTPHGGYVLRKGKGRCTTAHEYIFVMSKSPVYFWDSAAFAEESKGRERFGNWVGGKVSRNADRADGQRQDMRRQQTRNPRSVWLLASEPTSVAHFATFPSELVRRCIQAGTSDGGCCSKCGEPWAPVVKSRQLKRERPADRTDYHEGCDGNTCGNTVAGVETQILGYRPTCECGAESTACRVLDPFCGIGTTIQTAKWMGRDATGIELNPEYVAHAEVLIEKPPRWYRKKHRTQPVKELPGQLMLFEKEHDKHDRF